MQNNRNEIGRHLEWCETLDLCKLWDFVDWDLTNYSTKRITQPDSLGWETFNGRDYATLQVTPQTIKYHDTWKAELRDPFVPLTWDSVEYILETGLSPDFFQNKNHSAVILQWNGKKVYPNLCKRPTLSLRVRDGRAYFCIFNDELYNSDPDGDGIILWEFPANELLIPKKVRVIAKWRSDYAWKVQWFLDDRELFKYKWAVGYEEDIFWPYCKFWIYNTHEFNHPMKAVHARYSRDYYTW